MHPTKDNIKGIRTDIIFNYLCYQTSKVKDYSISQIFSGFT